MKKLLAGFLTVFALTAAAEAVKTVVIGKINADLLNFRLGPGLQHPVVCKLPDKTEVRIRRVVGNWLEIEAPASMAIYVSEARVGRNGVLSGELNMRSAMDAKAPCFGTLPKGAVVKKVDETSRHGWVRIEVPAEADIKIYAAAFLINYDSSKFDADGNIIGAEAAQNPPAAAAPEASTAPAEPAKAPATDTPAASAIPAEPAKAPAATVPEASTAPAEPAKAPAATVPEASTAPAVQEAPIEMQGVLTRWKYSNSENTRFALLSEPNGLNQAFITGDDPAALSAAENKSVKVVGKAIGRFGGNGAIILKAETITIL